MQKQFFGIKYPFTQENTNGLFIDLNTTPLDKIRSQLFHVIFTPKGQRLRMPDFGTNLINYIFDSNSEITWDLVNEEITSSVNKYVKNVKLYDIQILRDKDDENSIFVQVEYGSEKNGIIEVTKDIVKI